MMTYNTRNIRFGIILAVLSFFFFIGNYIIISKYTCFFTENTKDLDRKVALTNEFCGITQKEGHEMRGDMITQFSDSVIAHFSDSVRDIVREENEMIDQRMMWMLTLNGLLFTTLGFAWGGNRVLNWLPWILSGVGAWSTFSFGFVLQSGIKSIESMNELWVDILECSEYPLPLTIGLNTKSVVYPHALPWHSLPLLLYSAWLIVAVAIAIEEWEREDSGNGGTPAATCLHL
ncbi:MAG: hypothetical protein Q3M30_00735 [Candidatus Electrothrix sp. Rat3]|nr:hypothetical protein [Candidatus Electrothrix rattekaaiensis]